MNILVTDAPEDLNFDLQSTTQGDLPVRLVPTSSIPSAVSSVFGRVGAVVAVLGDYAASLVDNDSTVAGATVADALDTLKAAIVPAPVSSVFGRAGVVVAALNDYSSSLVQNLSTVTGATVTAALDALKAAIALNAPFGYFWGANTGAIGATNFLGRWSLGNVTVEANNQVPAMRAATLRNLRVRTVAGNISVANAVFTVRVNGAPTALTCTIAVGASSAADLVHSVAVNAGDLLSVQLDTGTTLPSPLWGSFEA